MTRPGPLGGLSKFLIQCVEKSGWHLASWYSCICGCDKRGGGDRRVLRSRDAYGGMVCLWCIPATYTEGAGLAHALLGLVEYRRVQERGPSMFLSDVHVRQGRLTRPINHLLRRAPRDNLLGGASPRLPNASRMKTM